MDLGPIRDRIAEAAARAGRDPASVTLVAVTKTHPVQAVQEAVDAGLRDVGENKVQEALGKMDVWAGVPVRWHLIGHLQSNKAKKAVGRFALIHSLDSVRLADELEKAAAARDVTQDVLVQVNVAAEDQKSGVDPADAAALLTHAAALSHLRVRGLMTMAPLTDDEEVQRRTFRGLRELRDRLLSDGQLSTDACELSMGMSQDYTVAVEEGATLLRLGTVLYGERT